MPTIFAPTVGPVLPAQGSVQASYSVQIAWSTTIFGMFQLDRSILGGPDVLAASSFSQTFGGPYDDLSSNGLRVEEFTTTRGKADDLSQVSAGSGALTVLDYAGLLNPTNTSSPLYGLNVTGQSAARPNRPCRIAMTYNGIVYPIFYGFVRTLEYDPGVRIGQAKIELIDLFGWLGTPRDDGSGASALPIVPRVYSCTTGQAVGLILDAIGWTDAALRQLDTGDTLTYFEANGDQTPLQLISDLVAANGGIFYIDAAGRAVFEDRNTRWFRTAYATIANEMQAITPGTSSDDVTNVWTGTRQYETTPGDPTTLTDSTPQVASDTTSSNEFGVLSNSLTSKYWPTDDFALQAMQWRLLQTKDPVSPLWQLQIDSRDDTQMMALAQAELYKRIFVSEARTGTSGDYFVEQIGHDFSRAERTHKCSMILSQRRLTLVPFVIGTDTLGGASTIGF